MAAFLPEVSSIVRDVLHADEIPLAGDTRFHDLPEWDSMDLISVVVEVECRMNLQFEVVDIQCLRTVDDLLHMIESKQAHVPA